MFFGFEFGVHAADFLVYNLDKEWLLQHEDIDRENARKAFALMRRDGGFIIHAHPFRERDYIDHIELFPPVPPVPSRADPEVLPYFR